MSFSHNMKDDNLHVQENVETRSLGKSPFLMRMWNSFICLQPKGAFIRVMEPVDDCLLKILVASPSK